MYETEENKRTVGETAPGQPDVELSWDSQIEDDSNGYKPLPDGNYIGRVKSVERSRHNGSEKIPPCPKAIIKFILQEEPGKTREITENLFIHKKVEWKLSQFFRAIGQKQHGERITMNWAAVPGSRIRVAVKTAPGKGRNGEERMFTNIGRFFDYQESDYPDDPNWLMAELQQEDDTVGLNPFEEEEGELPY